MIKTENIESTAFLKKSIAYLEATGFENIKADLEGYEAPKAYLRKETDGSMAPDIVAVKNGRKYYFDISLKSSKPRLLKTKWLFLDTLSRMKSNRFRIITTRGHYRFTEMMLDDINLHKDPIKI